MRSAALASALLLLFVGFALATPAFLSPRNLTMLAIELSITAVLALGMLMVLLPGLIDLSAGSGVGLVGACASVLIFHHAWPAPLAMLAASAGAIILWALMGTLIVRQKMPAFIITLGGLLVFKGLFWLVLQNTTVPVAPGNVENALSRLTTSFLPRPLGFVLIAAVAIVLMRKRSFLQAFVIGQVALLLALVLDHYRGVPLSLVLLALTMAAVHTVTQRVRLGRHLYAIGDNEEAARLSGIAINRTVIIAFAAMGAVVALTGLLQVAYAGAATTTVGDLMELDAIAACVIGGTSLKGGRGTAIGVLFGALIMTTVLNGMTLLATPPEVKLIARGAVLALAVWIDVRFGR